MTSGLFMRVAPLMLVFGGLVACVAIPLPRAQNPPRFSARQLEALAGSGVSRAAVAASLGPPDLRRAAERVWIYHWRLDRGRWLVVPLAPLAGGTAGPVQSQQLVQVYEFDADGILRRQAQARLVDPRRGDRYCTDEGVCLEHPVQVGTRSGGFIVSDYTDAGSVVSVEAGSMLGEERADPGGARCSLTVWLADDLRREGGWFQNEVAGLSLAVGAGPEDQAPQRQWLPVGAAVRLERPPGVLSIAVSGQRHGGESVQCAPGATLSLEIGPASARPDDPEVQLRWVSPDQVALQLARRARVLLH